MVNIINQDKVPAAIQAQIDLLNTATVAYDKGNKARVGQV